LAFHSGREADHSPLCSAEVKEWAELYRHSPNTPSWRGAELGGQGQLISRYILFYMDEFQCTELLFLMLKMIRLLHISCVNQL
jgi:hypothetical protein